MIGWHIAMISEMSSLGYMSGPKNWRRKQEVTKYFLSCVLPLR